MHKRSASMLALTVIVCFCFASFCSRLEFGAGVCDDYLRTEDCDGVGEQIECASNTFSHWSTTLQCFIDSSSLNADAVEDPPGNCDKYFDDDMNACPPSTLGGNFKSRDLGCTTDICLQPL